MARDILSVPRDAGTTRRDTISSVLVVFLVHALGLAVLLLPTSYDVALRVEADEVRTELRFILRNSVQEQVAKQPPVSPTSAPGDVVGPSRIVEQAQGPRNRGSISGTEAALEPLVVLELQADEVLEDSNARFHFGSISADLGQFSDVGDEVVPDLGHKRSALPIFEVRDRSLLGVLSGSTRRASCSELRVALSRRPESADLIAKKLKELEC